MMLPHRFHLPVFQPRGGYLQTVAPMKPNLNAAALETKLQTKWAMMEEGEGDLEEVGSETTMKMTMITTPPPMLMKLRRLTMMMMIMQMGSWFVPPSTMKTSVQH